MRKRWLAGLFVLAGCASAPVRTGLPPGVDLAAADARLLEGCYDCLIEARDTYARAAVGRTRPLAMPRLFEAEILLALRDKEFALDPGPALARARALVPELPAAIDAERVLVLVEAVPYESVGWTRAESAAFRAAHSAMNARVDEDIRWLREDVLTPAVAEYIARALDCGYVGRPRTSRRVEMPKLGPTAAPLLRYRDAACIPSRAEPFETLLADVPRFTDLSYYLGLSAVNALDDGGPDPRPFIATIEARLPDSPSVVFLAASMRQAVDDCEDALNLFDRLIALKPAHEGAWLGRVRCLTSLERPTAAVAAATRMIEMNLSNRDEAFYWRGRNYFTLGQLVLARADSDAAKASSSMLRRSDVFSLAGLVEHDQDDLTIAEHDLKRAVEIDRGANCFALWMLGSLYAKRQEWQPSAASFDKSSSCNGNDAQLRTIALNRFETNDAIDAEFRRAQGAVLRRQIERARSDQHASALNAANFYYQAGDLEKARAMLDIAETDESLDADVASMRRLVPKVPPPSAAAQP